MTFLFTSFYLFLLEAEAEADTSAVIDVESEEEVWREFGCGCLQATGSLKRVAIDAPPQLGPFKVFQSLCKTFEAFKTSS